MLTARRARFQQRVILVVVSPEVKATQAAFCEAPPSRRFSTMPLPTRSIGSCSPRGRARTPLDVAQLRLPLAKPPSLPVVGKFRTPFMLDSPQGPP